jgi:hypothetical protein
MVDQQQHVIEFAQPEKRGAHHQVMRQIEGRVYQRREVLHRCGQRILGAVHNHHWQRDRARRLDHLLQNVVDGAKHSTQHLMAFDQRAQRRLQGGEIEMADQAIGDGPVVGWLTGIKLVEKPEPLLGVRQWRRSRLSSARDGGGRQMVSGCQPFHEPLFEQRPLRWREISKRLGEIGHGCRSCWRLCHFAHQPRKVVRGEVGELSLRDLELSGPRQSAPQRAN